MLTERQQMILRAIVEQYVQSAEPVGSRTLSKQQDFQLSSATIRNEMADLEELGFLDQPHASAGRIPSQKGYRYYVDHLKPATEFDAVTVHTLRELFQQRVDELERVVQQTSVVVSQLTQYTSIVLGPQVSREKIHHIQLIPMSMGKAIAILVTDMGHVSNRQVQLSEDISSDEVSHMVEMLNRRLHGVPVGRLRSSMYREMAREMSQVMEHYEDAVVLLDELMQAGTEDNGHIYVGGAANMLSQPEFRDIDKVKPLLEMLQQGENLPLQQILPVHQGGVQVRIGMENSLPTLRDCTVISSVYTVDGVPVGSIGVVGPTRMNYGRVIQILDYVSTALTRELTDRASGGSS